MKLLVCIKCSDIFNLTRSARTCSCGKSGGLYVDNLNAEIWGECEPVGFANGSFIKSLQMQRIENKHQEGMDPTCCKGVEFTAFFIPAIATSVKRVEKP